MRVLVHGSLNPHNSNSRLVLVLRIDVNSFATLRMRTGRVVGIVWAGPDLRDVGVAFGSPLLQNPPHHVRQNVFVIRAVSVRVGEKDLSVFLRPEQTYPHVSLTFKILMGTIDGVAQQTFEAVATRARLR